MVETAMAECMSAFGYNTNCAVNCVFNASIIIINHGLKPHTAFLVLSLWYGGNQYPLRYAFPHLLS